MTEQEGLLALKLARSAIDSELIRTPLPEIDKLPQLFQESGAVFVTIKKLPQKSLRGCIGSLIAHRDLYTDIVENAKAAAFGDPRFPPMSKDELSQVKLELSVLTTPKPLEYDSTTDLLTKIQAGIDGVIIKHDGYQATFLPSVWQELPQKEQFLSHLCAKAGLAQDFYTTGNLEVYTYQTVGFSEA